MGLFDNGVKVGVGVGIGIGALFLVPIILPVAAAAARPLVKAGIKGGMLLYEKTRVVMAEAMETIEDLTAEAKAEIGKERTASGATVLEERV